MLIKSKKNPISKNYCMYCLPVTTDWGLSWGDINVSGQHFKCCGLPCSINPQQTKALHSIRIKHDQWTTNRSKYFLCEVICTTLTTQTSPGDTPTQIRSTAGMIVPLYVWQNKRIKQRKDWRTLLFFCCSCFLLLWCPNLGSFSTVDDGT